MSKLDEMFDSIPAHKHTASDGITDTYWDSVNTKAYLEKEIKKLFIELLGEPTAVETEDMSLKSWTHEDMKTFGKNELIIELKNKVDEL